MGREDSMSDEVLRNYREAVAELTGPGGPFALQDVTVRGRVLKAYVGTPVNLSDLYDDAVARHGDADIIEYLGERRTCAAVYDEAASFGAALRARYGIAPGDRIGIVMRNLPQWLTAFMAITRIGAIATLLNSRGVAEEIAGAADKVGCRLVIADAASCERLAQSGIAAEVIGLEEMARLCAEGGPDRQAVRVDPDAPAAILFTSGTTGRPKGATLTHRNLGSMAANLRYIQQLGLVLASRRTGVPIDTLAKAMPRPSALLVMPLFHVSGLVNVFLALLTGGLLTLLRRWDPAEAVRLIEKNRVTSLSGPSMVVADLLDHPGGIERMQSLSGVVVGGQATPVALAERISKAFPRAAQAAGWGMTELSGQASSASGAVFAAFPGTCGVFNPLFEGRIVDADDRPLPPGEPGELQVRGVLVMAGYFDEPDATARSFVDGWFKSGDVAIIDSRGILSIVDRQKDMVISAGENIYCAEVERVLGAHGDVADVVMFGVPDDRLGERAIAAVVLRKDAAMDAQAVQAVAAAGLADYKVPKEVIFDLGPFPRNAVGKVDKPALRARYFERAVTTA
jgi:acyl-CoA synthetase (AMP-forming)/AMP-acid ligase II